MNGIFINRIDAHINRIKTIIYRKKKAGIPFLVEEVIIDHLNLCKQSVHSFQEDLLGQDMCRHCYFVKKKEVENHD